MKNIIFYILIILTSFVGGMYYQDFRTGYLLDNYKCPELELCN